MFIWLFHRISGLVLILLFGVKIASGLFLYTRDVKPEIALLLHRQPAVDVLLLVLFTFHSLYGLRTVIVDLGFRREEALFRWANALGAVISAFLLAAYFRVA